MKKGIKLMTVIAAASVLSFSCKKEGCTDPTATNYDEKAKKDDGSCDYPDPPETEITKTGTLSGDETWTADKIYFLDGRVVVPDGVTLTIEPGTIIKGKQGQEANASALIVARGGMIDAVGTASNPIIFTSELDNIQIGQKVGTNLSKTDNEKWGGVAILGRAPISAQDGDTEANLEGIPPAESYGLYGGTNATDNSGNFEYVSIRHGGISIGEGNELNGLTLGGVGSGTTISNVEIYATLDDGIECFGGTVNLSNALVFYQGDDGLDLDMNYSGTIQNFAVIHGDGIGTDEGLEIDGPEGSTYTTGKFTLLNGLVRSDGTTDGSAGDFKDKAQGTVQNVTFDYSSVGGSVIKIRAKYDEASSCASQADALSRLLADDLEFTNCDVPNTPLEVYTAATTCGTELGNDQTAADAKLTDGSGGTINVTNTFSWTCAGIRGEL